MTRLTDVAEDQWGLVTRQQAQAAGIPRATLERLVAGTSLERVDTGVYRLAGAPVPDHVGLRAAWLRLAPDLQRWQRTIEQGVVSHRSAASMYGIGDLPADRHEFTVPARRQSRKPDVRFHIRPHGPGKWIELRGVPVTRPSRIGPDLLLDNEDPEAVAQIVAKSIDEVYDYPGTFAESLAPCAARFGLQRGDGLALLTWLLELVNHPDTDRWVREARDSLAQRPSSREPPGNGWASARSVTLGEDR
jgi:Transcriptional regulator, AbiEi antitoxin